MNDWVDLDDFHAALMEWASYRPRALRELWDAAQQGDQAQLLRAIEEMGYEVDDFSAVAIAVHPDDILGDYYTARGRLRADIEDAIAREMMS